MITFNNIPHAAKIYLVGGYVRDHLLGKISNDLDFEVFGLRSHELEFWLKEEFGFNNVEITGNGFPVYRVYVDQYDIQFSLPRIDRKVDVGYNGFESTVNPFMSLYDASLRRDLTFNSIYMDLAGNIYDPMNGVEDLQNGTLRPCSEFFKDDPVRVLRAAYFAAKFGFNNFAPELIDYSQQLRNEFQYITKEKVFEVWLKMARSAKYPSIGLNFLKDVGWLDFFGSLSALQYIPQSKKWHPEGDVWIHTLQVMDYYAEHFGINEVAFFATLLHDYGKIWTSKERTLANGEKRINAIGHEQKSVEMAHTFFDSVNPLFDKSLKAKILELVGMHMLLNNFTPKAARNIAFKLQHNSFDDLYKICASDQLSRVSSNRERPEDYSKTISNLATWKEQYFSVLPSNGKIKRIVSGDDLIVRGVIPGKQLGDLLKLYQQMQIDGTLTELNKEQILSLI